MEKNVMRAKAFLSRASGAEDLRQKLLCLYDGFVCIYGPADVCRKAAAESMVDFRMLQGMIDFCMDDGDSDNGREEGGLKPTPEMVDALEKGLERMISYEERK